MNCNLNDEKKAVSPKILFKILFKHASYQFHRSLCICQFASTDENEIH